MTIFEETKEKEVYKCKICSKNTTLEYKNIKRHLLDSESHERSIPQKDSNKHKELIQILKETRKSYNKNEIQEEGKNLQEESFKHKRGYLKFAAACYYAKLSFQQIQKIGIILKEIYYDNEINFLAKYNFSLDEISQMANCWGDYLKENLISDLKNSKYSLCLDNCTISGTNISAFQLRYLKEIDFSENDNEVKQLEIQNRVIGLKYLGESSTGLTIYNFVKDKLLNLDNQIKHNFVGLAHDHGSNLSGHGIGLVGQLKSEFKEKNFFNCEDPCHSLDLAVYSTLEELEDKTLSFVEKIHFHFLSPQRKAVLSRIQKEENLPNVGLKRYVETRWLSLGLSLKRLLQIWTSLIRYMENHLIITAKEKGRGKFLELLKDKYFKLRIIFVSGVIEKINMINVQFQNQTLEIDQLLFLMKKIIRDIAELIIKATNVPEDLTLLYNLDWSDNEEFLRDDNNLLSTLARELDNELFLEIIELDDVEVKNDLLKSFREFLQLLLKKLLKYLPIQDKLIQSLTFLSLNGDKDEIKQKILYINKLFDINKPENEKCIVQECNDLLSKNISWIRRESKGSSLKMWNLIEQTYGKVDPKTKLYDPAFPFLSKIFRTIHSFAPSSANVEQCFSVLKLLKSALRNSIKENTLESLIMIHEEFKNGKPITVSSRLIEKYNSMKKLLNEGKSKNRLLNNNTDNNIQGSELDENQFQRNEELRYQSIENNIQEINEDGNKDVEHISELLEKSCTMENEDEEKIDEAKVKKRLAKKTSYKVMLQNHDSMENPHIQQKFKKMKENI